jgi:hypothetical protein
MQLSGSSKIVIFATKIKKSYSIINKIPEKVKMTFQKFFSNFTQYSKITRKPNCEQTLCQNNFFYYLIFKLRLKKNEI